MKQRHGKTLFTLKFFLHIIWGFLHLEFVGSLLGSSLTFNGHGQPLAIGVCVLAGLPTHLSSAA